MDAVELTGQAADFSISDFTPGEVEGQGTMTFHIEFQPDATGDRSTMLKVTTTPSEAEPNQALISAKGVRRILEIVPSSLTFAEQRVGVGSSIKPVTLKNSGSDPLAIKGAAVSGSDFRLPDGSTSATIEAGKTREVRIEFRPRAVGKRTTTLTVTSDSCSGTTKTMSLTGTGIAPAIRIDPQVLDLGQVPIGQPSERIPLVVSNDGKAPLRVSQIQVVGADSPDFAFESLPTLPRTVAAGDSFLLNVIFTPSSAGTLRAGARITSDDLRRPIFEITLTGVGGGESIPPTSSPTATPTPTRSPTTSSPPRASGTGGGGGDWIAIVLVVALVGGAFAGLLVLKRMRAEQG